MKLHLPKLLRVAVIAAVMGSATSFAATLTKDDISYPQDDQATTELDGASYLNIGTGYGTQTWKGNLTVGKSGDVENVGAFENTGSTTWTFYIPDKNKYTKNFEIKADPEMDGSGNLIVQEGGKIILGGQRSSYYQGLTVDNTITVTGGELTATKIIASALDVSGGTVKTHTGNCSSGNRTYYPSVATNEKQSYIKDSITLSGGTLKFGFESKTQGIGLGTHINVVLGANDNFKIAQTGGKMQTYGDCELASGSTITQSGTNDGMRLVLRDTVYMRGSGTTTIEQNVTTSDVKNRASLVIGRLESVNSDFDCSFEIKQKGNGWIHLAHGSNFAKDGSITINQDGTGVIQIGGEHVSSVVNVYPASGTYNLANSFEAINTTYIINQTNGELNIAKNGAVKVADSTIGGKVIVAANAIFGAEFDDNERESEAVITVTEGGQWSMADGSYFGINFSKEAQAKLTEADDIKSTADILDFEFDVWASTGADTKMLENTEFKLIDMDERLWKLKEAQWNLDVEKNSYITGIMEFNPWIAVDETSAAETFSDASSYFKVGLEIDGKTVTLAGDNSHSMGTKIKDSKVTLNHKNALGQAVVTTEGNTTLTHKSTILLQFINLPHTIVNKGSLTLSGTFDATGINGMDLPDILTDVDGTVGNNGFRHYERFEVVIVDNDEGTNATLALGTSFRIKHGTLNGTMDISESGAYTGTATFERGVDYATYVIDDEHHSVSVTEIQKASGNKTETVKLIDGTLTVNGEIKVDAEGGKILTDASCELDGELADVDVDATGGTISADITGTSDVTVTGDTTLAGNNTYTGGTVIDGATLTLAENTGVGEGDVQLKGCGTFDMGGNALTNKLIVTGCTLKGAQKYAGEMEVSHELVVEDVAKSKKVTLIGEGTLVRDAQQGGSMTTDAIDVQTTGDATLDVDLTINDNGTVTLNDGKVLMVNGSLTLAGATTLALNGDYAVGDKLLTGNDSLEEGTITLVYNDSTVELERIGNSIVLVSKFKQDKADMAAQANWGIATTSRAFVNTVRGQHSNTGCIADGRGTVWAAAFGAYNDLDGSDINVKGAAVGVDAKVGSCSTVGIAFGYAEGEVSPTGLRDADQEGEYVALYGTHGLKKLSSTSCLSLDWVAAYGNTESEWNSLKWEQDSLQLNTRLNWNKKVTERLGMSVFGGLEYFATGSDTADGVKSGSIQNLRGEIGVGARYVAWGTPASQPVLDEKGATLAAARPGCEKLVLNGEIRYFNDMVRSNPVIEMDGLRGGGENPGRQGMGIEAGATYRISERWSASANYSFNAMEDSVEHRANVGASYTF